MSGEQIGYRFNIEVWILKLLTAYRSLLTAHRSLFKIMDKQQSMMEILKLYELRRDEKMREARAWYFSEFAQKSAMDIIALYRGGEQASAYFRMVASFWDMAAWFVFNEAIDEKMFFDSGTDHIFVFDKIQPFLAEIRQLFGEPDYFINLEQLVMKVPNVEAKLESRQRLIKIWTKENKELSVTETE